MRIIFLFLMVLAFLKPAFSADPKAKDIGSDEFFTTIYLDPSCLIFNDADPSLNETDINGNVVETRPKNTLSSKYIRPLSARVVECLDGTMSNLFLKSNPANGFTLFQEFQSVVKPMVILILVLYIAVNGYLIAMGQMLRERPKQEILLFILKFALVFYFSIGDAWKDFFFVALRSISSTFGTILIEAGSTTLADGCTFTGPGTAPYPPGKGYIAIFDTIDCKFANYMGWFTGRRFPVLIPLGVTFFFIGGIGPFLFAIVFVLTFQLIILVARIAQLYLTSIMVLTLLVYASPILVPMALFKYTEEFYKNWLSKIIGLSVHPVLVFAFAGILISVTDKFYYGPDPDSNNLFVTFKTKPENKKKYEENLTLFNNANEEDFRKLVGAEAKLRNDTTLGTNNPFAVKEIKGGTQLKDLINCGDQANKPLCDKIPTMERFKAEYQFTLAFADNEVKNFEEHPRFTNTLHWFLTGGKNSIDIDLGKPDLLPPINADIGNKLKQDSSKTTQGADVDGANCYGGPGVRFDQFVPIVCIMGWLENTVSFIPFPIPQFLEIIEFYIPTRPDLALMFFVIAILYIFLNLVLGLIFEQLQTLIDTISGQSVSKLGSYMGMWEATKGGFQKATSGMQDAQDKVFKREQGPGGDKPGGGAGGGNSTDIDKGGGGNSTDIDKGGGGNETDIGKGGGDAAGSAGDAAGSAADGASEAASGAADAASNAAG